MKTKRQNPESLAETGTDRTVTETSANRMYKARLFEMIFSEKEELLELYNAMNGTNYKDPALLEINTLKNAIYLSMHNDVSFIIDSCVNLYEHQSTFNPNLPLRCLMYIADLYSVITKDENLYGEKLILIPTPKFFIFYNGTETSSDAMTLKLSDAFTVSEGTPSLELTVTLLNINPGHNQPLLSSCKTLRDYSEYVARVRKYAETMKLDDAVELAITECIREGILAEFLTKHRAEAKKVSIYEYDEEKHMRQEREYHFSKGLKEGLIEGRKELQLQLISKKLEKGKSIEEIASELEEREENIRLLMEEIQTSHRWQQDV